MKDYQLKKTNYHLSHNVYMQTLYIIRDYNHVKTQASAIMLEQSTADGMPRGNTISNPVESKVIRREPLLKRLNAINDAIETLPIEYRKGVFEQIVLGKRFPDDACTNTYSRWRQRFIYEVAKNLGLN